MQDRMSYLEILERLNGMVETVVADCIPNGKKDGKYWRGDLHGKISVHLSGGRIGTVGGWQGQFGGKIGTNLIGLIQLAYNCASHGEAVKIAKERYLGIHERELTDEDRKRLAAQHTASEKKAEERRRKDQRDKQWKAGTAKQLWAEGSPIPGTPAEIYLRSRLIEMDQWPPSLRFHSGLPYGDKRYPALIGAVQDLSRKVVAIWRVYLTQDGQPLRDAEGKKVKLGFGPAAGGAVRFGPVSPVLRLAEGMETALGVMLLTKPDASVWATLSTSGMIGLQIPEGVRRIEIYADGDRHRLNKQTDKVAAPPGIYAAHTLKLRAEQQGIEVAIFPSPEPDDWLDVYQNKVKYLRQKKALYPEGE